MKKLLIGGLSAFALTLNVANADSPSIKVGTVAGPETDVMQVAAEIAQREYGLTVEIIEFTDYVTPNAALADGSLDANAYQHEPYMQAMVNDRGYDFAIAGYTFVYPIGAYSEKYDSIDELPEGAQIALPNDPSNEGRALILMHNQGLITLEDPTNLEATPIDILANPKNFRFREIEAAQLPRVLPDVDLAFINNTFAQPAGLSLDDALIQEGPESPYVNLIVVRDGDEDRDEIRQLVNAYQTEAVVEKASELFGGAAVPGWVDKQ
ncbi:MetQ/NlpA family ABC transporter substrate-binding protein [Vreelandella massiliensis]|uniref:MetQ/NlpA family ABC transporter substrate-binding protein n=1 Tax=Vreelandella massiliensis TaxID=1816686 RepID=UPI00096A4ED0|nr:MetQ/NlpA family ABC transporter substrate-binding protein [Halomonas massiliensis]